MPGLTAFPHPNAVVRSRMSFPVVPDRPAYVRAGFDPDFTAYVFVDLADVNEGDRELLAEYVGDEYRVDSDNPFATEHRCDSRYLVKVPAPTPEALLDALRAHRAKVTEKLAAREAARVEILQAAQHVIDERRAKETGNFATAYGDEYSGRVKWQRRSPDWPEAVDYSGLVTYKDAERLPGYDGWAKELDAENAVRAEAARQAAEVELAEKIAAAAQASAAKKAQREHGIHLLREWATEHASRRVRLLIEEEHKDWLPLAEDEFLDAHTPARFGDPAVEGAWAKGAYHHERILVKPTEADIVALRAARKLCDGIDALTDPTLAFVQIFGPANDDDDASDIGEENEVNVAQYRAVRLTVTTPTGVERKVFASTNGWADTEDSTT